ncbi:MAG: hypothetical protein J0G36_20770 [Afipia sp.]|nr:hypothetical protein [Afipia sp.]
MMISIFSGEQLFEMRECPSVRLADGREAALWRGLAYPLSMPDCRIDITGEAFPALEHEIGKSVDSVSSPFGIIEGVDEAYIVFSGSIATCESTATSLKGHGYEVIRTGRYLGDPIDGIVGDWFVRVSKPKGELTTLTSLLTKLLGNARPNAFDQNGVGEQRARLIAAELAATKAREATLRAELARSKLDLAEVGNAQVENEALRIALEEERRLREEADSAALAAISVSEQPPAARPAFAPGKLGSEIEVVFDALLPDIHLVRDSLIVIVAEFLNRKALYRALADLKWVNGRLPPAWKKLQGLENWWERHISNGQDDAGRIYARPPLNESRWEVLISHKGEQSRDIAWLDRQ